MGGSVIVRLPGWEARLSAHIVAHMRAPFRWGKTDCAMFAAGAVKALSGVDLARGFRGYRSEAEGLAKVLAKEFEDYEAVFAARLRAVGPEGLNTGDVAVVEHDGRAVMCVWGGISLRCMTPTGMGILPSDLAVRGYAV